MLCRHSVNSCIYSTVASRADEAIGVLQKGCRGFVEFTHHTPVPVDNRYATPHTLGRDRLAGVVGAAYMRPGADLLVIDAGSAVTYDFIDAQGCYHGGSISPGLKMRLRALHDYTGRLPLVEVSSDDVPLIGCDTSLSILSGVIHGMVFEMEGHIAQMREAYPMLSTFLTGGCAIYFADKLKSTIFAEENLILTGLNRILRYNNV